MQASSRLAQDRSPDGRGDPGGTRLGVRSQSETVGRWASEGQPPALRTGIGEAASVVWTLAACLARMREWLLRGPARDPQAKPEAKRLLHRAEVFV